MSISSRRVPTVDNISTYDSAGGADYSDMAVWEAATDIDLVTATQGESLKILQGSHDDQLDALGATVNASYFRRVFADVEHDGTRGGGGSTIASTAASDVFNIGAENYFAIQGLTLTGTSNNAGNFYAIDLQGQFQDVVGCLIYALSNTGAGAYRTIINRAANNRIINTLIENCESNAGVGDIYNIQASGTPLLVSNVTIFGTGAEGVHADTANLTQCINVLVDGLTTCFSGTYTSSGSKNNASSDSSAPGANSVTTANPTYVDEGGKDYHISESDSTVKGVGFDQSAVYTDDIDNNGDINTWNIGADSFASGGPAIITAPSTILWAEKGTNLAISSISVTDSDDDLDTVKLEVTGTGCWIFAVPGDSTVVAGANGSSTVTFGSATEAQLNATLATTVFNSTTYRGKSVLTITATDDLGNVATATVDIYVDVTNLTFEGTNADLLLILATLQGKLLTGDTTDTIEMETEDSGGATDTDNIVLNLAESGGVAGTILSFRRRRRQ